jgi:hypothetical protein
MIINLTQDQFTIVDDIDYEYLLQFKWYAKKERTGKFYAVRNERVNGKRKHKNIYIHRVIAERMGLDLSCDIDHIDRDSLNNLRNNLRFATKTATSQNRSKHKNNTSGIPGVYWHKVAGKWQAQIKVNNKTKYLGLFGDINEAAEVYKEASLKYFKEFSPLNGE